jgi:hypothetical protein
MVKFMLYWQLSHRGINSCVCVCVWIESEREGTCFINPSKSSLERRHSLPKPSVMRSSGVSVPRTEIITDLRWCRTTTKYSLLAILWFLVKKIYLRFYDSILRFEFILYVSCRVKKAFLTTLIRILYAYVFILLCVLPSVEVTIFLIKMFLCIWYFFTKKNKKIERPNQTSSSLTSLLGWLWAKQLP